MNTPPLTKLVLYLWIMAIAVRITPHPTGGRVLLVTSLVLSTGPLLSVGGWVF
jgi:hypothetical protein